MKNSMKTMVDIVYGWYLEQDVNSQNSFRTCDEQYLYDYHHSLGRDIRNHFKLWDTNWIPEIVEGVDFSENHPDAISMEVIKQVWCKIQ